MLRWRDPRQAAIGKDYEMSSPFGSSPVGALLHVLARYLPADSAIELITPIGDQVKAFLRRSGHSRRPGLLYAKVWSITHSGPQGILFQLAALAEAHTLTRLSVWFTVVGPDDATLLEAEDGNSTLFLADALTLEAIAAVIKATGIQGDGVRSAAFARP